MNWIETWPLAAALAVMLLVALSVLFRKPKQPNRDVTNAAAIEQLKCKEEIRQLKRKHDLDIKEANQALQDANQRHIENIRSEVVKGFGKGKREGHSEGYEAGRTDARLEMREAMAEFLSEFARKLRDGDIALHPSPDSELSYKNYGK